MGVIMSFRIEKTTDSHGKDRYKVFYISKAGKESLIAVNFNGYIDYFFVAKWSNEYKGITYLLTKELSNIHGGHCTIRYEYSLEKTIEKIDRLTDYEIKNCFRF